MMFTNHKKPEPEFTPELIRTATFECKKEQTGNMHQLPYSAVHELVLALAQYQGAEALWRCVRGSNTVPDELKRVWVPESDEWVAMFLGNNPAWICGWLDDELNENSDHAVIFDEYIVSNGGSA